MASAYELAEFVIKFPAPAYIRYKTGMWLR